MWNEKQNSIAKNIAMINERIQSVEVKCGRETDAVKLIAVTKNVRNDLINQAILAGLTNLGENRVQEFLTKTDIIKETVDWHFIGHLQTNKVKYILQKVSLIHSVDKLELAQEIQKKAMQIGKFVDVLLEINVSGEASKFGVSPDNVKQLIEDILPLTRIRIKGFMTVAPFEEDKEKTRPVFRRLKKLMDSINQEYHGQIRLMELSMGMSNDFEVAIQEGATMVRIGTAIFGDRMM